MFSTIDVMGATVVTTLIFFVWGAGGADPGSSFLLQPVAVMSENKIRKTPLSIIRFISISPLMFRWSPMNYFCLLSRSIGVVRK
jgi:hypothetical protein